MFGKVRGANSNKFNRSTKLFSMYGELIEKMDGYMYRGEALITQQYRKALCVKLLLMTGIRVGNESSAEGYTTKPHPYSTKEPEFVQTFGLITLKRDHVSFKSGKAYFNFVGKKQVENTFEIKDRLLVKQLKSLYEADLPTDTFFEVSVSDLTKFIKKSVGRQFSPKDFRTMRANIFAWEAFELLPKKFPSTKKELNAELKSIAVYVSEKLNNTPGVCKTSYIDAHLFHHVTEARYGS